MTNDEKAEYYRSHNMLSDYEVVFDVEKIDENTKVYIGNLNPQHAGIITNRKSPLIIDGDSDFYGCTDIESFGSDITFNGNVDFSWCTALATVPKRTIFNGKAEFFSCSSLLKISNEVVFNGEVDLMDCSALSSIPEDTVFKGFVELSGCTSLTEIPQSISSDMRKNLALQIERKRDEAKKRHQSFVESLGRTYQGTSAISIIRKHRITHCYSCKSNLDNTIDFECNSCGWIVCSCGACGCGYSIL